MGLSIPGSNFGHIYQKALYSHLKKMGSTLKMLRETRKEDIHCVAAAINIRPEILQRIENGEVDFRVKTLFALCDYYHIDEESLVNKGALLHFIIR